jgi:hypothetical protein
MIGSHNSDYAINFYNDRVKEVVPAADIAEPFTYVPIVAGHMELVGGNAVVFGKITEGYDVISPIMGTEITFQDVSTELPRIYLMIKPYLISSTLVNIYNSIGQLIRINRVLDTLMGVYLPLDAVYEGSNYTVVVKNDVEGINLSATYLAAPGDTPTQVKNGLYAAMLAAGIPVVAGWPWEPIWMYRRLTAYHQNPYEAGDENTVYKDFKIGIDTVSYVLTLGNTIKWPDLKCGAIHGFGIVYKDKLLRQCSVMKTIGMSVYIPFFAENPANLIDTVPVLTFYISHKPPEWAETYEIVYYGNMSMDWYLQIRADAISQIGSSNRYAINIQDTINWTREENARWKVADYVWQEGDRLRLVGTIDNGTGVVTEYSTLYDYEIEEVGTEYGEAIGGDWLICQAIEHPATFGGADNVIVEVYRPRKGLGKTVPYGSGMVFEIATDSNGFRYHKGNVDQVLNSMGESIGSAEVLNLAHDSYKYIRINYKHNSGTIFPFWCESIFPSDWWTWIESNKLTSQGFPFLDDLSQRQTVLDERLRHGGYIITGTRTNNIAHFTYEDFLDLPKKNGDITALREVGYVLKVLQLYKETSIYINRIQNFNADGSESFTLTNKFLGTTYPLETDFGCQHPDGVMVNGRNLYYWDDSQGAFIRSAPNGQIVLDTKVKRWYKDLSQWIRQNGGGKVLEVRIGMNNDHDEVWISFRIGTDVTGLIFSEKDGRYKSRINLTTENYIHLGSFFAHLYRQRIWIMNIDEGQDYLSWVGVETQAEIEFISNVEPNKIKVFNAVALYTDHQWTSESKSIVIPEEASAVNEIMETNIAVWDRREGIYYGAILKDENSKGNFATVYSRKLNGRTMRGRYIFAKFIIEEHTEKVRLDSIIVFSTGSERSA